jgi:hypothetical protein
MTMMFDSLALESSRLTLLEMCALLRLLVEVVIIYLRLHLVLITGNRQHYRYSAGTVRCSRRARLPYYSSTFWFKISFHDTRPINVTL